MRATAILLSLFITLGVGSASAEDREVLVISPRLIVESEGSSLLRDHAQLISEMFAFLATTIGVNEEDTEIYFVPFQHEANAQLGFISALQSREEWSADKRRSSTHFLGYTYSEKQNGKRIIQMDPDLVTSYYTRDPSGMFTIPRSPLWYALGHEMAHDLLYAKGVSEDIHHCVMIESGLVDQLIAFLETHHALAYSGFQIKNGETRSCENSKHAALLNDKQK